MVHVCVCVSVSGFKCALVNKLGNLFGKGTVKRAREQRKLGETKKETTDKCATLRFKLV